MNTIIIFLGTFLVAFVLMALNDALFDRVVSFRYEVIDLGEEIRRKVRQLLECFKK